MLCYCIKACELRCNPQIPNLKKTWRLRLHGEKAVGRIGPFLMLFIGLATLHDHADLLQGGYSIHGIPQWNGL